MLCNERVVLLQTVDHLSCDHTSVLTHWAAAQIPYIFLHGSLKYSSVRVRLQITIHSIYTVGMHTYSKVRTHFLTHTHCSERFIIYWFSAFDIQWQNGSVWSTESQSQIFPPLGQLWKLQSPVTAVTLLMLEVHNHTQKKVSLTPLDQCISPGCTMLQFCSVITTTMEPVFTNKDRC